MYIGKFRETQCISSRNREFSIPSSSCSCHMLNMDRVLLLSTYLFLQVSCYPYPGSTHHHIHHRIHVPHKIKTIYHTKIIKVPEHHHYFHEKEKIIHVETPKKEYPLYPPLKEDELGDFSDFDHHEYFGESRHNFLKKRAPTIAKKGDPVYPPLNEEDSGDFLDSNHHEYVDESRHNILKKRAPTIAKKGNPVYLPLEEEDSRDFSNSNHHEYVGESRHNILKKTTPTTPKKEEPVYTPLKEKDLGHFSNFDHHEYSGENRHNVLKRRPPTATPKKLKKRKVLRSSRERH